MTLFGVIWLSLIALCFIHSDIRYMITLTVLSMVFQCSNVIILNGRGIGPQVITGIIFIILITIRGKMKFILTMHACTIILPMLGLYVVVLYSSYVNKVLGSNILVIMQLLVYILCFICMNAAVQYVDRDFLYSLIRKITIFLLIIGIIQILITSGVIPRIKMFTVLFYNEKRGAVYYYRNNYIRILSTYMEPSYFAGFIVGAFYYFINMKSRIRENIWLIIMIILEIIFTFSSTAYGTFFVVGIIFLLFSEDYKNKILIVMGAGIGFIILYYKFYDVLDRVIFSKTSTGSGMKRNGMNIRALRAFFNSPWIGFGYKNFRASSIIYCLLAEIGSIGTTFYILMFTRIVKPLIRFKNDIWDESGIAIHFAVLCALVAQVIACPDLDLTTLWFWMYCVALHGKPLSSNNLERTNGNSTA